MIFDDAPKSVTEESSLENEKYHQKTQQTKMNGKRDGINQMMDSSILNQNNNYCQS